MRTGEVIPFIGRLPGLIPAPNGGCPWSGECSANPAERTEMKKGEKYSGRGKRRSLGQAVPFCHSVPLGGSQVPRYLF